MSTPAVEPSGILLINKHAGATSHDIVYKVRRALHTKRVGHTGTLDPMATGVLVVLVGRAAKACEYVSHDRKVYRATLRLGLTTDTEDVTGTVLTTCDTLPSPDRVAEACSRFTGKIQQIPPMYSALKVDGQKLCDLARKGIEVERAAREVEIYSLSCEPTDSERDYILTVDCSGGTYIRTLCADIGAALGCGGVMTTLERVQTGTFPLDQCITTAELEAMDDAQRIARLLTVEVLFSDLPRVCLSDFYKRLCRNGCEIYQNKIHTNFKVGQRVRICDANGHFFALGEVREYEGGTAIAMIKLFELE
ncbi:MAG: tRNA pseudouridine(55) synthase TruB [Clostridia bacterium]|nr:tRNA pseudouridine(55) synthase TruB [Clostridia bacterium]